MNADATTLSGVVVVAADVSILLGSLDSAASKAGWIADIKRPLVRLWRRLAGTRGRIDKRFAMANQLRRSCDADASGRRSRLRLRWEPRGSCDVDLDKPQRDIVSSFSSGPRGEAEQRRDRYHERIPKLSGVQLTVGGTARELEVVS